MMRSIIWLLMTESAKFVNSTLNSMIGPVVMFDMLYDFESGNLDLDIHSFPLINIGISVHSPGKLQISIRKGCSDSDFSVLI